MLSPRDLAVARLVGRGFTHREAASRTKISNKTVARIMAQPQAQELAQRIRETVNPDAVATLQELLTSHSENVRLAAARALLGIAVPEDDPNEPDDTRPYIQVTPRAGRS